MRVRKSRERRALLIIELAFFAKTSRRIPEAAKAVLAYPHPFAISVWADCIIELDSNSLGMGEFLFYD